MRWDCMPVVWVEAGFSQRSFVAGESGAKATALQTLRELGHCQKFASGGWAVEKRQRAGALQDASRLRGWWTICKPWVGDELAGGPPALRAKLLFAQNHQ